MRWIKHMTAAHADKAMALVSELHGPVAPGIYWGIVEEIAGPMEAGKMTPESSHSVAKWASILNTSTRTFTKICKSLQIESLIFCETIGDRLTISIPNILKYKDEYARKSGQTQEQEQKQSRADTEQRREETAAPKRVNSDPDDESAPKIPSAPLPNFKAAAQSIWEVWLPKRRPTAATIERYLRTRVKEHKGDAIADLEFLVKNAKAYNESEGEWAKGAEVWFGKNGYCWSPIASGSLFAQNGNGTARPPATRESGFEALQRKRELEKRALSQ